MNAEEYQEQRGILVRQWARTVNIRERKRRDAKIARHDDSFGREFYGIRRARESSSHTLQSFGVV